MANEKLLSEFHNLFGSHGGDVLPGNVGQSNRAAALCHEVMTIDDPVLFHYFTAWDDRLEEKQRPFAIEQALVELGQWEGAWGLAQLHYDQFLKTEAAAVVRQHKGHPLCNLALAGQAIGSPSLTRHYALLASAGDVYWELKCPALKEGGLAPTLAERSEPREDHYDWRQKVRKLLVS